jgi:hypothetical protein
LLGIFVLGLTSGCSSLSLHKSPPPDPLPKNPWIKPAKEEKPGFFKSIFTRENKKPDSPKDWLALPRPE